MTVLTVELESGEAEDFFIRSTKSNFLFTDLFGGKVYSLPSGVKNWHVFSLTIPMIAPFGLLSLIAAAVVLFFAGVSWWLLLPALIGFPELLKSKWFVYLLLRRNLRKQGYTGSIRVVSDDEVVAALWVR